jgi:type IV pilus assembly protein PilN
MANKVISIEIGLQVTKICEVSYKTKNPRVYQVISFPTPEDTFEDGYIRDKYKFVAAVKDKMKEAGMKSTKVIFTVASNKIANREVVLPLIKEARIQDVVNTNASEYFPVDLSEYSIAYSIIEKIITKEEKKLRLLVLAAPNNLIKNYYSVAELMGLEVINIDYAGNSAYQLIKKQSNTGTNLFVQINEQTTLLSIIDTDILKLQRTISFGTMNILHSVVSEKIFSGKEESEVMQILTENELINANPYLEEAAATLTLFPDDVKNQGVFQDNIKKVSNELSDSLHYLINNIVRVLDYYNSKNKTTVDTIYLTGQGSKLKGMDKLLHTEIGIVSKRIETLNALTFDKTVQTDKIDINEYISCIGASINPVQFANKEYLIKQQRYALKHSVKFIFAATTAICVIFVMYSFLNYKIAESDFRKLNSEIDSLSDIDTLYNSYIQVSDSFSKLNDLNNLTKSPNDNIGTLIKELEEKLPADATVESLNITPTDISLSMRSESLETTAKTLQQLKTITTLTMINTSGLTETENENGTTTIRFTVTGQYTTDALREGNNADTK